jgi:predicted nucleic acid-binding protein
MLVDTAVWIDHLRRGDPILVGLLEQVRVTVHPFVVGEVACGHLVNRTEVLDALEALPKALIVEHSAVLAFVERNALMGRGLGWVDMHLLASASASGERILTRDRRLEVAARNLGLAHEGLTS